MRNIFANPEQRPFQMLLARFANNSDLIFATWNLDEHRKRHSVITTSLFVCLIVFFLFFFFLEDFLEFRTCNYYSPANSSAACCIDCRAQSIDLRNRCMNPTARRTMIPTMLIDIFNALFSTKITSLL
jgi:hypothetical protein